MDERMHKNYTSLGLGASKTDLAGVLAEFDAGLPQFP
jgi:hypothetical protein